MHDQPHHLPTYSSVERLSDLSWHKRRNQSEQIAQQRVNKQSNMATKQEEMKAKQEQAKKEQQEAMEQVNALLNQTRPKNLGQGLTSGLSNIVGGALGAVGVAVVAPIAGGAMGLRGGGLIGGVVGVAGGAVVGVVGAAALAVGGATMGVMQIVRGIGAQPEAMMAPSKGKWWDENQGKWVYTNLVDEAKTMVDVPEDDSDLLKEIEEEIDMRASTVGGEVKDSFYYDVLEVDPKADPSAIKRKVSMTMPFPLALLCSLNDTLTFTSAFVVLCSGSQISSR